MSEKQTELKRLLATNVVDKVGQKVKVQGWASTVRDHGSLVFIDLRDWSGIVQIVVNEQAAEAFKQAKTVGLEYVLSIEGTVVERDVKLKNEKLPTGGIEISAESIEILNTCKQLPFPLDDDGRDIDENLRLKYRFIDIRRKRINEMMKHRHALTLFTRNWFSGQGFTEIETPILTVSTPEGARDFLVPSRIYPGKFFALPQSPQQYKQLLMVGGVDKYFQIAPCARDEDPRADRHSGFFYQIDVECSYVTQQEFFDRVEPFFKESTETLTKKKVKNFPFAQIPYEVSQNTYGSDKPDLRFEMKLVDFTKQFNASEMSIFKTVEAVRAVVVDRDFSRKETDELTEKVKLQGGKGLAVIKMVDGKMESSLLKFFSDELQAEMLDAIKASGYEVKGTQTIMAVADVKSVANKVCGWLRSEMGTLMGLKDPNVLAYAWVVDFPMFEWSEKDNKWDFGHNPFSMPQGGLDALKTKKPEDILSNQYDLVCNGYEMASGSIRNFHPLTLIEAFKITGYSEEETRQKFGHMISAFEFGAPPHGGFAPGLDRMLMVLFDESNIREVYAFPQTNGQELMMGSPREVPKSDMDILGLQLADKGAEVRTKVLEKLEKVGAKYQLVEHEEARTSEDAAKFRGTKLSEGAKAIVVHSLEYASKYIQIVVPADKQVDLKKVEAVVGEKLEVGKTEDVEKFTGLKVGAIPPFGRLMGMEVYFDGAFWAKDRVAFNVGSRNKSIIMQSSDLITAAEPNKISKGSDFTV